MNGYQGYANHHYKNGGHPFIRHGWGHGGKWHPHHHGGFFPGGFALGTLTGLTLGATLSPPPYPAPIYYPYPSPYYYGGYYPY